MALKNKRSSGGPSQGGNKVAPSFIGQPPQAGVLATQKLSKRRSAGAVETIEARLERKATVADTKTLVTESLGQMTREKRHKLLYGG